MDSVVEVFDPLLLSLSILLPRYSVHSWRSLPLQREITVPKQIRRHVMQQCGELLLLISAGCFPHTSKSLGHVFPSLCPARVRLFGVPLGRTASLHALRRRFFLLVRALRRCRVGGGAFARWPPSAAQTVRAVFPHTAFTKTHASEMQAKELVESS